MIFRIRSKERYKMIPILDDEDPEIKAQALDSSSI
jgi:hypothetical protein